MGSRIIKMDTAQGFAAQGAGAAVILASTHVGFPLSTTHMISGGVIGAGAAKRVSAVRWGVAGNIVVAWVLTLPAAALIGAGTYGVTGSSARGPWVRWSSRRRSRDHRRRIRPPPASRLGDHRGGGSMIPLADSIVDWSALFEVVWASLLAGIGVTAVYGVAILGGTRAGELRRDGNPVAATLYAIVCGIALAIVGGAIVFGIVVMTTK